MFEPRSEPTLEVKLEARLQARLEATLEMEELARRALAEDLGPSGGSGDVTSTSTGIRGCARALRIASLMPPARRMWLVLMRMAS